MSETTSQPSSQTAQRSSTPDQPPTNHRTTTDQLPPGGPITSGFPMEMAVHQAHEPAALGARCRHDGALRTAVDERLNPLSIDLTIRQGTKPGSLRQHKGHDPTRKNDVERGLIVPLLLPSLLIPPPFPASNHARHMLRYLTAFLAGASPEFCNPRLCPGR